MLLPFIPPYHVQKIFKTIKNSLSQKDYDIIHEFFIYLEKVYIGKVLDEIETLPSYEILFWNHFDSVLNNIPRTINYAERWNRILNDSVGIVHPNIAYFIETIKNSEITDKFNLNRAKIGIYKINKNYLKLNEEIFICVKHYTLYTEEEFLNSLEQIFEKKYLKDFDKGDINE